MYYNLHANFSIICYYVLGCLIDELVTIPIFLYLFSSPGLLYLGSLSLQDTHRLIKESFALVNSSLSEGQATAVLEAQAFGTVVIVKDIPSNQDIVQHDHTGLIYATPQVPVYNIM